MRKLLDLTPPNRSLSLLAVGFLLVTNLFVFGPAVLYNSNPGEFRASLVEVMPTLLLAAAALLLMLLAAGFFLPEKLFPIYVSVLLALGVLSYLHGNIFVWDYGVLDGTDLSLASSWKGWVDGGLWLLALWGAVRFRNSIARQAWMIASTLVVLQLIGTTIAASQATSVPGGPEDESFEPPSGLSSFSAHSNIVHLILDAFQSDIFEELLDEEPSLSEAFDGFTFFRNATTPSAVTYLSVPSALSGRVFRNDKPISEFMAEALNGKNLFSAAKERGWDVDLAVGTWWNKRSPAFSNYYRIPSPYTSGQEYRRSSALLLADLSLFRQSPHFLKAWIYNGQSWLFSSLASDDEALRFEHFAHLAFLDDLTGDLSTGRPRPVYKLMHLITPHAPQVVGDSCGFAGEVLPYTRENFKRQSKCTLESILRLFEEMRNKGVYDSSVIVVHGDHGGGVSFTMSTREGGSINSKESRHRLWGAPLPMVLVKPRATHGPLHVSRAPVELPDIPATLASLLGWEETFPGRSMFDIREDERRVRSYYWSSLHRTDAFAKDYFDSLLEYRIEGSVFQEASWSRGAAVRSRTLNDLSAYVWNSRIEFGLDGNSKPYQLAGWVTAGTNFFTWTQGDLATLRIPVDRIDGSVTLEVEVKPLLKEGVLDSQRVDVLIDQRKVGEWRVTHEGFHKETMAIPADWLVEGELELGFKFQDARAPVDLGINNDERKLALAFHSVLLRQN